jgi:hypothetical protein
MRAGKRNGFLFGEGEDRGRESGLALPLPPNRTGGFPASGFPVSGLGDEGWPL